MTRHVTPFGPAALWFGARRRASCIIAGVFCLDIIGTDEIGVSRTRPSQENGAPGGSIGSGERATVSICASFLTTSAGVVMRRPDVSSLRMERSVGIVVEYLSPVSDRRIYLSATLGVFTNMRRRALSYLRQRRLRACRAKRRAPF